MRELQVLNDKYPELANTHKFYDMTRQEMMEHSFKKVRWAYENHKEEWFTNLVEGKYSWAYS